MTKFIWVVLFSFLSSIHLYSQNARILDLDNENAYRLIEKLKERGHLTELNPVKLPYTFQEVNSSLSGINLDDINSLEKIWVLQLQDVTQISEADLDKEYLIKPYFVTATEFNDTKRKDVYRPKNNELNVWPYVDLGGYGDFENLTIRANIHFDLYYEFGLDGIDPTNRLYIRNENSYVGYRSKYFSSYLGRIETNWGQFGKNSTFLSRNALAFDQFQYTIGTDKISFTSLNGVLDNLDWNGQFDGNTVGSGPVSKRRYLGLKRFDWRINKHLQISFKEAILYSGENVNLDLRYMVPSFLYFFLEGATPRDQTENLLLGGSIWFNKNGLTLYLDAMLDDLIGNREERGIKEKNNFGIITNASYFLDKLPLKLNIDTELITYQAYNTDQAEGRYLYLNRGIATNNNDYFFTEFKVDYFGDLIVKGLTISPYYGLLKQGEQVINQTFADSYPNGNSLEYFLTGTVESTNRVGVELWYAPNNFFWVKSDLGFNFVRNKNHIIDNSVNRFASMIEVGFIFR
jgi:hypothetical protein